MSGGIRSFFCLSLLEHAYLLGGILARAMELPITCACAGELLAMSTQLPFTANESQPDVMGQRVNELRNLELQAAIHPRRRAAGVAPLPDEPEKQNLVGLALSGGGIRSAVYNLGFLQALHHRGLLRHVDYLCSVSGGGYIGGHLAALADNLGDQQAQQRQAAIARGEQPAAQPSFHDATVHPQSASPLADLGADANGRLKPEYRFRHVGEYLFANPFQFIWRYLACTLPMLLLAVSSLGFLATIVALAWRSLDSFYARDLLAWTGLHNLGVAGEFVQAFLPCVLPAAGFLIGVPLYWYGSRRKSRKWRYWGAAIAKWSVVVGLVFLACSLAVFLGNGESRFWFNVTDSKLQSYLTWPLLALTVLFLVPMVRFRSVVNSAREGAPAWQAAAARFVIVGACTCTPFFMVHWMSAENISGFATYRDPDLHREDITQWPEYQPWRKELAGAAPVTLPATADQERLERITALSKEVASLEDNYWGQQTSERHAQLRNAENMGGAQRAGWFFRFATGLESPLGEWLAQQEHLRQLKQEEVQQFNQLLGSGQLTALLHQELCDLVAKEQIKEIEGRRNHGEIVDSRASRDLSNDDLQKFIDARLAKLTPVEQSRFKAFWDRARSFELDQHANLNQLSQRGWQPIEIKQFNRLLLEVLHPEFIRQRAMVSTLIVPWPDQVERFRWLGFWSLGLVLSCFLLDFNRTSPFYIYYRDRLHQRFLRMPPVAQSGQPLADPDHHDSTLLKDLEPWKTGAPYPLFVGSLHLFNRVSPREGEQHSDAADAERCLPMLFSPLRCGSAFTEFCDTKRYCNGTISVADAVAISGAAVTPFMTTNSGLLAMMAAFNLRIGKWLPRPDRAHINGCVPKMYPGFVAREFIRSLRPSYRDEWEYALAADGGFHEFFGLEELLLRRCRLILVSDAGCNNGKFEFGALADTIRLVRERHGIEFLDLDHDQPVDLQRLKRHPESRRQDQHHICMRVRYPADFPVPGPREALVVYAQMSLTGDEALDLQQFRQVNPNFPDEPTTNQRYDANQVESFRQLGHHVGMKVCQRAPLKARRRNQGAEKETAVETWIDWLRWGYIADCAQASPLPRNRLRNIDPRSEAAEFDPERRSALTDLLSHGRRAFQRYLGDPRARGKSLQRAGKLLSSKGSLLKTPRNKQKLTADLVKLVLACHDLRADFHCSNRRDLFATGGRRHLIRTASLAADGMHKLPELDFAVNSKDQFKASFLAHCELAATFYWRLCRGVFSAGNRRTAALATMCLIDQLGLGKRAAKWENALDCVVSLVRLAKRGKLWKVKRQIYLWYSRKPAQPAPPAAALVQAHPLELNGNGDLLPANGSGKGNDHDDGGAPSKPR